MKAIEQAGALRVAAFTPSTRAMAFDVMVGLERLDF